MRLRLGFILLLVLFSDSCRSDLAEIAGKIELYLDYLNTGQYSSKGWCDPFERACEVFFTICIWSPESNNTGDCNVAQRTTKVIGKRIRLKTSMEIPLVSMPKTVHFKIQAWDWDNFDPHDLIAEFESGEMPISSGKNQYLLLKQQNATTYNSKVKIDGYYVITCSPHHYGPQCETYCEPDYETYRCGKKGERKCLPGWYGELCNKVDMCFHKPCAPFAHCSNIETTEDRICYCNGGSGPECYEVPDPCNPSPCKNAGVCSRAGPHLEHFLCECQHPWYGPICEQRFSACAGEELMLRSAGNSTKGEVCLNGGICQDDLSKFEFSCVCPTGWKGERCEMKDHTVAIVVPIIVLFLIAIGVLLFFLWKKRRPSKQDTRPIIRVPHLEQQVGKVNLNGDLPNVPIAISNDIYGVEYSDVHEVQLISEEDEYSLVHDKSPSRRVRKSYEGAIRYASLIWDKTTKSVRSSKSKEEELTLTPPPVPHRSHDMRTPLIDSTDDQVEKKQAFLDKPSSSLYECSKDDAMEEPRDPLPVRDTKNTHRKWNLGNK